MAIAANAGLRVPKRLTSTPMLIAFGMDVVASLMLKAAWIGFLGGVISGAIIGLFFSKKEFMGGYNSWRRRLVRLGHISFFGLGFVNALFAFTQLQIHLPEALAMRAAIGFLIGAIAMPLVCFLAAWNVPLRHLFFIPVAGVSTGIITILVYWPS